MDCDQKQSASQVSGKARKGGGVMMNQEFWFWSTIILAVLTCIIIFVFGADDMVLIVSIFVALSALMYLFSRGVLVIA